MLPRAREFVCPFHVQRWRQFGQRRAAPERDVASRNEAFGQLAEKEAPAGHLRAQLRVRQPPASCSTSSISRPTSTSRCNRTVFIFGQTGRWPGNNLFTCAASWPKIATCCPAAKMTDKRRQKKSADWFSVWKICKKIWTNCRRASPFAQWPSRNWPSIPSDADGPSLLSNS